MDRKFFRNIIISVFLGFLIFAGLAFYGDVSKFISSVSGFSWWLLPVILLLSLVNYFFRFLRWHFYISRVDIKVTIKDSLYIFYSGLLMAVSPGKLGELLKSFLLKEIKGTPLSESAPIVFSERFTDFLALLFLSAFGIFTYEYGIKTLIILIAVSVLILVFLTNEKVIRFLIRMSGKIGFLKKYESSFERAFLNMRTISSFSALSTAIFLGTAAWFSECVGFYLVFRGFGVENVGIASATFIYCFSTVMGAVSMLPGGMVFTEGTMMGLLSLQYNFTRDISAAVTVLIRLCTLWFGSFLGLLVLVSRKKLLRQEVLSLEKE